jgi:hypothetical protein
MAFQAVDGSKVAGNAARDQVYDAGRLQKLLERTEAAISDLEAQNHGGEQPEPPRLPEELRQKQALAEKVKQALARVAEDGRTNLTDPDAVLLKGKDGFVAGYNVQAVVSPLSSKAGSGQLITAACAGQDPGDHDQLLPMLEAAAANCGRQAEVSLADAGYHSAENLEAAAQRGHTVIMPESQSRALASPYHKDAFSYDAATDSYTCPQGKTLRYSTSRTDRKGKAMRVYRIGRGVCQACPVFGACTKDRTWGRALHIRSDDAILKHQREFRASPAAQALYKRRQETIEPTFGIIKEQQGGRRLMLRGLANANAEWSLLAVAFNLRTLARVWRVFLPLLLLALLEPLRLLRHSR